MKVEFRVHYWPATPHLREVKLVVDDEVVISSFMSKEEVKAFAEQINEQLTKGD